MRQGQTPPRRSNASGDINSWMTWRNANVARRGPVAEADGREVWNHATRTGRPVEAQRPSDVVRLGIEPESVQPAEGPDNVALEEMDLGLRFQTAKAGSNISALIGSSDPRAVGKFLSLNGMDGRDSILRAGRRYVVPTRWNDATANEEKAGQRLLGIDNERIDALAQQRAAEALSVERLVHGRNAWTGKAAGTRASPQRGTPSLPHRGWEDSPEARAIAGTVGWGLGLMPGVIRGGVNTVKGAVDGAYFMARLADPYEFMRVPPGHSAATQLLAAGGRAGDYVRRGFEDPSMVRDDIASAIHNFEREQNPFATPMADTVSGEFRRGFDVGMNNGELAFDVGSLVVGGEALRGAAGLGRVTKAPTAMELAFRANDPDFDTRLGELYDGMSHHIVGRKQKLPAWLGGGLYPEWFIESEFNKIRHQGMTTRDVLRNHIGVDDHYYGGKAGGTRWSGARDLGWTRYGPLDRLNYGTSPYTKGVAGTTLVGGTIIDSVSQGANQ
jgi:hypothetical protein